MLNWTFDAGRANACIGKQEITDLSKLETSIFFKVKTTCHSNWWIVDVLKNHYRPAEIELELIREASGISIRRGA